MYAHYIMCIHLYAFFNTLFSIMVYPRILVKQACLLGHFSHIRLFATPWTGTCQAPLSMGISRQEYYSGFFCPPPGDLPDPG